jgi:hypothetical protein
MPAFIKETDPEVIKRDPAAFQAATARLLKTAMQAITVRYIGATSTNPSRVVATTSAGDRLVMGFGHAGDLGSNQDERTPYAVVALALHAQLGWDATHDLVMGGGVKGGDYVFVQVPKAPPR